MKFTDFNLDKNLEKGISDAGYVSCMPVQEKVLESGLSGADLYVQSQTGSGKTAAYLVTVFQRMLANNDGKKALIMAPTRELAVQIEEEAKIISAHTQLKPASFYGGVGYNRQLAALKQGANVLIGTPGRIIDLQKSGSMKLDNVAFLVIDEADRMFDMGFYPDLRSLIKFLPPSSTRQTMLFSATLNTWVKNLAWEYTSNPVEITIEAENITVDEIDQRLFHVASDEKMQLLCGIIRNENPESLIIFCNTKRMSEVVAKRLRINGFNADFIIGDLPQAKRLQVINAFKSGKLKCLVATDVAARGLDVEDLAMVINFDLPEEAENYVHRIGRTARAGKTGKAYSFCSEQDVYNLPAIERYIGAKIPVAALSDDSFSEDKSAGVYIKIARYDSDYDDEAGRKRPGDRREKGQRHSHGQSMRPARPSATAPAAKGKKSRRQGTRGAGQGTSASRKAGFAEQKPKNEQDLSKLTFEERMRYYQEKYGQEKHKAAASAQSARPQEKGSRQAGEKKRGGTQGKAKGNANAAKAKKKSSQNAAFTGETKRAPAKPQAERPSEAKKPAAKGVRGLIRKLFGTRGK